MGGSADEFPLLSALGLYAADIRGDGKSKMGSYTVLENHLTSDRKLPVQCTL